MTSASPPTAATLPAGGLLAQALQEPFTVAVRLRANHPVATSSDDFRERIRPLLANADRDARSRGYGAEDVRAAVYAFVAFLDESVLNSPQPMFADWTRRPMQEELFGDHMAGEVFFQKLADHLGRQDSAALADLLEVYLLCLLLGFRGRYSTQPEALATLVDRLRARITSIRGRPPLGPDAGLPSGEVIPVSRDPWVRRLLMALVGLGVVALLLWGGFRFLLGGALDTVTGAPGVGG